MGVHNISASKKGNLAERDPNGPIFAVQLVIV